MLTRFGDRMPFDKNIFPVELVMRIASLGSVTLRLHPVVKLKYRGIAGKRVVDLLFSPDIERPFRVFRFSMFEQTIGVFSGKKSALFWRHVPRDVIENISSYRLELSILRDLKRIDVGVGQLCLVV